VILDKGRRQGVVKDMAVVVEQGLVGRILEAGQSTSRAILLVDPEARIAGLAGESRAQGLVGGDGSALLRMRYLDLDSGIRVEENVLTSGATHLLPKGLRIGKIESVTKDKDGLHLMAIVRPFVAFTKLEEVLCLAPSTAA
jgi:rod shape-determining protein MreC